MVRMIGICPPQRHPLPAFDNRDRVSHRAGVVYFSTIQVKLPKCHKQIDVARWDSVLFDGRTGCDQVCNDVTCDFGACGSLV
jgi:hypothetical protein